MDHIQGLGFFAPLFAPGIEVHIWGPGSTTLSLRERLSRYLSPPLFPVMLRELPNVALHEVGPPDSWSIGNLFVKADLVVHPGPTLGYRIEAGGRAAAYLPDHEPALGARDFLAEPAWTSGFDLAVEADVLIHDAQYTAEEYPERVGWGHSTFEQAVAFATAVGVGRLVTFHHDPAHSDEMLDAVAARIQAGGELDFEFTPGKAGLTLEIG